MSKSFKFKMLSVFIIAGIICAGAASAAKEQPCNKEQPQQQAANAQPQQEKPSTDSVLVEAYLVQVSNMALAASGTALLQEDIGITKLLWCMKDPNGGKVLSMARVSSRNNDTAQSGTSKTVYISHTTTRAPTTENAITSTTYQPYNSRNEIEARPYINEDGRIVLQLKFRCEDFTESKAGEEQQAPPGKLGYDFDSTITIKPNQPMIVGGMQSGDSSLFLVVRAEVVK